MSSIFKDFRRNDIVTSKTLINEALPLTGTIVSGTYSDENIKNYAHGMFQTVYDYPYLSSSANAIFDLTVGYSSTSGLSNTANVQNSKKINIYNQMAQVLVGHDIDGTILEFDEDGDFSDSPASHQPGPWESGSFGEPSTRGQGVRHGGATAGDVCFPDSRGNGSF
jgi:hypothetical protein